MPWPIDFSGVAGDTLQTYDSGFSIANSTTGSMAITAGGRLRRNATTSYNYVYNTLTPPSADYWVEADFFFDSTTRTERFGVTGRNSTSALTFYLARVSTTGGSTANVQLWKWVAGTPTQLGSSYAITISGDPTFKIRLDMVGTTIRVLVDGVERINVTDSSITAAGRAGFYGSPDADAFGDTTGMHLDNYNLSFAANDVTATGSPATITLTAPTGTASSLGGDVTATGSPPSITLTAPTGTASATGLPLALVWDFDGGNADNALTVITDAETTTPSLDLVMRSPEQSAPKMWQHFFFGMQNPDGAAKTVSVTVDLTNKDGGSTILSTWSGPYQSSTLTDHTAWAPIARNAAAGILSFTVTVPAGQTVYVSSMPPNTQAQIESRIAAFAAAYPSLIHDDLPSRLAENSGPYIVDRAPTVIDELGRTFTNRPMFGFRVGNDSAPGVKPKMLVFANRHPGEHHGNFQLWGFLNHLASSSDPALVALRNGVDVYVYPQHAVNGIAAGYRRHEPRIGLATGDDINREWKTNSLNHIAVQWISVLTTDHGAGYDRVAAVVDFHDLSYSTQLVVYYYRTEMPNVAAWQAIINAEFTGELAQSTSNADTATDYFVNTVGTAAFTAEVSDEATSLSGFEAVGAGWANIAADWYGTGLFGAFAGGSPAQINVSAPSGIADDGIEATGDGYNVGVSILSPVKSLVVESTKIWRG